MTEGTRERDGQRMEDAVSMLFGIGRMWARHGLEVAELALQTSARTLRATAGVLSEVSRGLDDEPPAEQ